MVYSSNNTRVSSIVPGQKYTPDHSLFMSTFIFPELQTEVSIRAKKTNTLQSFFQMYGLLLEEDTNGIIYNTIGVNGAEFRHFNNSDYFQEQLKALQPDLIIVSLGTNDGYVRNFDMNEFYFQAQTFVKTLQASNVAASILLTTPPGVKIRNRRDLKAQNVLLARNAILNLYRPNGVACWDLYGVLKKYRRILTNQKPSADKVHFRKAEYEVQGELLYNVLMDGYKNYISGQRISTTEPKTENK